MPRKLITAEAGLEARIFHEDGKGMRGITLLSPSGVRQESLSVAVHDAKGHRKALNCLSLKNQDFPAQWARAVKQIADYYGINADDPLYDRMTAAQEIFLRRYGLKLETVVVTYRQTVAG